jgi:hypothetical protein
VEKILDLTMISLCKWDFYLNIKSWEWNQQACMVKFSNKFYPKHENGSGSKIGFFILININYKHQSKMGLSENVHTPQKQVQSYNSEHADKPLDLGLPHFQTEANIPYPKKKTYAGHWTHDACRPNWERTFILLGELNSYSANDNISQTK